MRRHRRLSLLRRLLPLCSCLFALPLAAQRPAQPPAQPPTESAPPPFVETIEVREVELRVDLSSLPTFESIGRKGQQDFLVVEAGIDHELSGLRPAPEPDWVYVLYFDSVLAGPEARGRAAIELAAVAERLTAGGLAEIVVADPLPHSILTTGSPDALRRQLDEIAVAALREPQPASLALGAASAVRMAQLDRLTVEIAQRGGGGARALLLPVGSWPFDPEGLSRFSRRSSAAGAERAEFAPVDEAASVLAGYGWVTMPLALRSPREASEPSAAERRTQVSMGGGGDRRTTVPIVSISGQGVSTDPGSAARAATLTDFSLMPFAELARTSSGALIGEPGRLKALLAGLASRRVVTYRSPFPQPGGLLPLEVRWKGGDGRLLAAPRWLRSAIPPEATAARLRRGLAGDALTPNAKTSGIEWRSAEGRVCFAGEGDKRWVRLSSGTEQAGEVQLTIGAATALERGPDGLCLPVPPLPAGRSIVLVEDLESESWSGDARSN